jgi:acetolactate synthase regulatory subunit
VTLDVEPRDAGRSLDIVARQLDRLVDVHSVSVSAPQPGITA